MRYGGQGQIVLDRKYEDRLEGLPVVHATPELVSGVMDRVRASAADRAEVGSRTSQTAFPYLLWSTTAIGLMLVVAGYGLAVVENGIATVMLQSFAVTMGPVMSGVQMGLQPLSPATLTQLVGMVILLVGLLVSGPAKPLLKTPGCSKP